jgi:methionine--tRNA ligase beta chain
MQYDRLFIAEDPGKESGDFATDINKDSLKMIENVIVEPSVSVDAKEVIRRVRNNDDGGKMNLDKPYHSDLAYQFERIGYFALDSSSTDSDLVFNRVVTLKDTWNAASSESVNDRKTDHQPTHDLSKNKNGGGSVQVPVVEDARRIALRAGTILEAGPHSAAESLIVCKLDCGDVDDDGEPLEPRTVVTGLAGKISFEELINRRVVCLTNLKPAKMRGVESTAMLLAASNGKEGEDEVVQLLDVPESVSNGELLFFEDMEPCEPDAMLKSKGAMKVWDRVQARLRINENGEATYLDKDNNSVVRKILTSHGPVKAKSLRDCMIG